MKPFHQYWTFSAIRGAMTLLASIAILTVPQATSSILSLPVLITLAIDCLATYSVLDGAVMVLLAKLLPARANHQNALYEQAFLAVSTGMLLYLLVYEALSMHWLMWIVAFQAGGAALFELAVARDTHRQYGCFSCYATSIVLGVAAIGLPFAAGLDASGMALALGTYVGLYGSSELLLGGRMLFLEYRSEHPAALDSEVWRMDMRQSAADSLLSLAARKTCALCATCPADALCHDDSLTGQMRRVLAERRPAIVLAARTDALLKGVAVPAPA